jgi:hypothetical protein
MFAEIEHSGDQILNLYITQLLMVIAKLAATSVSYLRCMYVRSHLAGWLSYVFHGLRQSFQA